LSNYTPDSFFQLLFVVRGLKEKHREVIYTKMKERYNSTGGTLPTLEDLRGDIESLGTAQQIAKSNDSEQTQDGHEFGSRAERKGRGPKGLTFAGGASRGGGSGPCFICGIFGHRADKCMLTEEEITEKKEMDKKFVKALFEKRKADKKEKESASAARASTAGHTPAQKSKKKENTAAALCRVEDSDSDAFTDNSYDSDTTYF